MPPVVDHAFSLILIHNEKFGYITFDLECDSLKDYYILYCGFRLKLKELKNKQKKHIELEKNYLPSWLNNCFPNNKGNLYIYIFYFIIYLLINFSFFFFKIYL